MEKEEFEKQFNELKDKHNFFWEYSCDFFAWADILIYRNENDESPLLVIEIHDREGRYSGIEALKNIFKPTIFKTNV